MYKDFLNALNQRGPIGKEARRNTVIEAVIEKIKGVLSDSDYSTKRLIRADLFVRCSNKRSGSVLWSIDLEVVGGVGMQLSREF